MGTRFHDSPMTDVYERCEVTNLRQVGQFFFVFFDIVVLLSLLGSVFFILIHMFSLFYSL